MNIRNPQSIFAIASIVVLAKFALSELVLFGQHIPAFTGSDFAMSMAAIGSIYSLSAHIDNLAKKDIRKDESAK